MLVYLLSAVTLLGSTLALRTNDTSICDYYTPIVTGKNNTATSQQEVMLKITHTFIIGNYTLPNVGVKVAGIASPGTFEDKDVQMLPYFDAGYASSNDGGSQGVAKNFLDDGGSTPLEMNKPANTTHSNQYTLLTHVYQYFGTFFNCSQQGSPEFPAYQGRASMYEVHKYMDIDKYHMDYFNQQIVLAVASLGFEQPDIDFTNKSLYEAFSNRCSPAATVIPADVGAQLQSICIGPDCPLNPDADCAAYPNGGPAPSPVIANASLVGNASLYDDAQASATAMWQAHCLAARDGQSSGSTICATASGTAAPAATSSNDGAVTGSISTAWAMVAALSGLFYIV